MLSASALLRHCGHPRAIEAREAGPEHDREACAKKKRADGSIPGCRTCGRHSPTCSEENVCVICSAPRGDAFHAAIETWAKRGLSAGIEACGFEEVRGWVELLATYWKPPTFALYEEPMGLNPDGGYELVIEDPPGSHEYRSPAGNPLLTAGRADVVWSEQVDGIWVANVIDFKTGKWEVDPPETNLQLGALGLAAVGMYRADAMRLSLYYARLGKFLRTDVITMDSEGAARIWADVEAASQLDDEPKVGSWCPSCWDFRKRTCRAVRR